MIHFSKDMELLYKDIFKQMKDKKCPECGMVLLDNYLGFIKHLAVDHEKVMKFVNEGREQAKTVTTGILVNEAESRSTSPDNSDKNNDDQSNNDNNDKNDNNDADVESAASAKFDLRAILDSSDSDSD